jgi:hypothetical protein
MNDFDVGNLGTHTPGASARVKSAAGEDLSDTLAAAAELIITYAQLSPLQFGHNGCFCCAAQARWQHGRATGVTRSATSSLGSAACGSRAARTLARPNAAAAGLTLLVEACADAQG